jgi:hypothetical protein
MNGFIVVILNWNAQGQRFQNGVVSLRHAYQATDEALQIEIHKAQGDLEDYQEKIALDPSARIGEWADDGSVIWELSDALDFEIDDRREALTDVRKSFIVTIYHFWERSAGRWTNRAGDSHSDLIKGVQRLGVQISPKLEALKHAVNVLKHSNDARGKELLCSWPALFPPSFVPSFTNTTNWYEAVQITDNHVMEAFDIVAESGPGNQTTLVTDRCAP